MRTWEKRYGVCRPERDEHNVRQYAEADLQLLIKISYLNQNGHRISSLADLSKAQLNNLYERRIELGDSGCGFIDKLTLAIEKTQESVLYELLSKRLDQLGIDEFAQRIWEPMQKRLSFLILSGGLHRTHLKLFDQTVERLLESENAKRISARAICLGSALLINTCGKSPSIWHHMVKYHLIENKVDIVGLTLCQSDWSSLESILKQRRFNQIFIHYQAKEFKSPPPYDELDQWIDDDVTIILYGSDFEGQSIPDRWKQIAIGEVLNYIDKYSVNSAEVVQE